MIERAERNAEEQLEVVSGSAAIVGQTEVGEADLRQAHARLPGNQRTWLLPVLMVAFTLLYLVLTPSAFTTHAFLTFVLPVAFVAIFLTYARVAGKRIWVKQALANVGGSTTFRFDDFGFSSESKLRQHRLAWGALARAVETPEAFLIYTTPQTVLIVPKRAFSDAHVAVLRSLFPERIKPQPVATGRISGRFTLLVWVVLVVTFLSIWHFLSIDDAPSRRKRHSESAASRAATAAQGGETRDVGDDP